MFKLALFVVLTAVTVSVATAADTAQISRSELGFTLGDSIDSVRKRFPGLDCREVDKMVSPRPAQSCYSKNMQGRSTYLFNVDDVLLRFESEGLVRIGVDLKSGNIREIVDTMKSIYGTPSVEKLGPGHLAGSPLYFIYYRWADQETTFEVLHYYGINSGEKFDKVSISLKDKRFKE